VLQFDAVRCSVLQCVAVCCSVLQCAAVCCRLSVLYESVCSSMSQSVALCCSVLQCVAGGQYSASQYVSRKGFFSDIGQKRRIYLLIYLDFFCHMFHTAALHQPRG